jgi:ABC-type nitrate/sulfonate/bicarbonate transport system permease component
MIWQFFSYLDIIPSYKLASPIEVVCSFSDLLILGVPPGYLLHNHLFYSLYRVFLGYLIAASIAIPLGLFMGWSVILREIITPIVEMVRPIPPLAWIPMAILWFGIGIKSAVFIIFLGAFFPILSNTILGVCSIEPKLIDAARTLNAMDRDIFIKILIPGATPSIFVGMRIAVGIGWMTLVAAEFTGVKSGYGLGYMIMTARDIQRPDEILAGMIVIGLVGTAINIGFRFIESKLVTWK